MNPQEFSFIALLLGAACFVAAVLGRRVGNERRDLRLMMGSGAALGGLALALMAFGGS